MALIKCSECGKEVSDKAPVCPSCGNPVGGISPSPIQTTADSARVLKIEPELTSKNWKKVKLISWFVIVSGFIVPAFLSGSLEARQGLGWLIVFFGVVGLIVGKIGAWYADKRTR